jgi:hypothetical protein
MPRANPARSRYCATRHLLRNLDQPRKLRRNPLAGGAFAASTMHEAARAISARVDRALDAMHGARHASILLRVDVQRHDPKVVAADLGLSTRHFHRERRIAHDRFFDAYQAAELRIRKPAISVDADFTRRLLERAASLGDSGEASSALAILADMAESGADPAMRCEALTRHAEVDAWAHRLDRARVHLAAAEAVLMAAQIGDERRAALDDGINAVSLSIRWFEKGPLAAAHAGLEPAANGSLRLGRTTLVRAAAALRAGDSTLASQLLGRIAGANGTVARTPEFEIEMLTLQAELADYTAEHPLLSEELFARAAAEARARKMRGRELYATHQLALTRWAHTRDPRDRSAYRGLVDRIDRALPPRLRSYLTFSAADLELAIGHPRRALSAAQAAAGVSTNRYERFSASGLAAGALLRLGRINDAAEQASLAAEAARAEGHARVLSLVQRISAQASLAQGNRRAARAAIDESIECARRFSSAHVLAQAQAVRARITER